MISPHFFPGRSYFVPGCTGSSRFPDARRLSGLFRLFPVDFPAGFALIFCVGLYYNEVKAKPERSAGFKEMRDNMENRDLFIMRELGDRDLEQFNSLLKYAFQVTSDEMLKTGWRKTK